MNGNTYRMIIRAEDVTQAHIDEAVDCRSGAYGGEAMPWPDVIDRIEASGEDWGSDMDSEAIRHLKKEVRNAMREA